MTHDERLAELRRRTIKTIERAGHQVNYIFPTEDSPGVPFGYTVGRTLKGRPELLMTGGLPPEAIQGILNGAAARDDEEPLEAGQSRDDILQGYPVRIVEADPEAAEMNQALDFYGDEVTALQILWPDSAGRFPGEGFEYGDDKQPSFPPEAPLDTSSNASRQHFIDTGRYLREGEACYLREGEAY